MPIRLDPPDQLAISALEHWSYCPRRFGLVHIEQTWADNERTVVGHQAHQTLDRGETRHQPGRRLHHAVVVWSDAHKLYGVCDAVEEDLTTGQYAVVEHKVGSHVIPAAILQVTAQTACLAEQTGQNIDRAYVYTRATRRRHLIPIGDREIAGLLQALADIHAAFNGAYDLRASYSPSRCDDCSAMPVCLPV